MRKKLRTVRFEYYLLPSTLTARKGISRAAKMLWAALYTADLVGRPRDSYEEMAAGIGSWPSHVAVLLSELEGNGLLRMARAESGRVTRRGMITLLFPSWLKLGNPNPSKVTVRARKFK